MVQKTWFRSAGGDWFSNAWAVLGGDSVVDAPPVAGDEVFLLYNSGELDVTAADTALHGAIDLLTFHLAGLTGQPIPRLVSQGASFGSRFALDNFFNSGLGTFVAEGQTQFAGTLTAETADAAAVMTLDIENIGGAAQFINTGTVSATNGGTLAIIGNGSFVNDGTLDASVGSIAMATALVNNRVVSVEQGGALTLAGPITGTGTLAVGDQATLTIAGLVASGQSIAFRSGVGAIALGDLADMHGQIMAFTGRDAIDLLGVTATATTYDAASSTLTVLNGTSVIGSFVITGGSALNVVGDQKGGTILTAKLPGTPQQVAQYEVTGADNAPANWISQPGTVPTVYYGFDPAAHFTTAEQAAVVEGLTFWSDIAKINFAAADATHGAEATFTRLQNGQSVTSLSQSGPLLQSASINFDTTVAGFSDLSDISTNDPTSNGGYGFQTILHEEGHLLGLNHSGNYNDTVNIGTQTVFYDDSRQFSIMSYVDAALTGANYALAGGVVLSNSSPAMDDILAAQSIYGANTTSLGGNDVFGFNSTFGAGSAHPLRSYDFTADPVPVTTLWDGGTNNTLDLSGFSSASTVNLSPGSFSSADGLTFNIAIAYGTAIDKVIGGSGNDILLGNSENDVFTGGGGNDTITGGSGQNNTSVYRGTMSQYRVTANADGSTTVADTVSGRDGTDTLRNIQTLQFADGSQSLLPPAAAPVAFDFNGDGHSDLLLQNDNGTLVIETQAGLAVTGGTVLGNPGAGWHVMGSADFNGDGKPDILLQNNNGAIVDYLMNGTSIASGAYLGNAGPGWHVRGTADFNGDGRADIVLQNDNGAMVVWYTNGSAVTGGAYLGNPGAGWTVEGIADFNGDGHPDMLLQNSNGALVDYLMNGATITAGALLGNPGAGWSVAGTADFNGDGKADILLHNDNGTDVIWTTNGSAVTNGILVGNPGASWTGAVAGLHLSGSGSSDLLLQNTNSTVVGFTLNTSAAITAGAVLAVPGAGWHAMGNTPTMFIDGTGAAATLTATPGADQFDLTSVMAGLHQITGFDPAQDSVALSASMFPSLAALQSAETAVSGGTSIALGAGSTLLIQGVSPDLLTAANFVLR